jgi:hypothetical protein
MVRVPVARRRKMSTVHSIHLTKRAVRLLELCEAEGFENIGELLEASIGDSVCPAICMDCGCTAEMLPHLLNSRQRAVFVQARHGVVDDDYFLRQLRVSIERHKEKGESESISISRAQRIAERRANACACGESYRNIVDDDIVAAR